MQKRFQVFVSSTFKDLKEEREVVMRTLLELNFFPAGMEIFPAADDNQIKYIEQIIDDSDYYILIIAGKYGSMNNEGISYTELEFDYALKTKKPILAFIHEDTDSLSGNKIETDSILREKLLLFKNKVQTGRVTKYWKNKDELAAKVSTTLSHALQSHSASGWVKYSEISSEKNEKESVLDFEEIKTIKEKIVYYKLVNLKSIEENPKPIYEKRIKRINKEIKICSEYSSIRIVKFNNIIRNYKSRERTSGDAIDLSSLFPFVKNLSDKDGDKFSANFMEPIIFGPSDIFITRGDTYNGFKYGDLDLGTKAEKDIEIVRLIVDFSSIPNFSKLILIIPQLFHRKFIKNNETGKESLKDIIIEDFEIINDGIYFKELKNMRKDEALRFEFSTDIETSSNYI